LQTRRLIAGDSISLDQDKSFYCVIDGMVQVFTQTGHASEEHLSWDEENMNGFQLLNEVRRSFASKQNLADLYIIDRLEAEEPSPDCSLFSAFSPKMSK